MTERTTRRVRVAAACYARDAAGRSPPRRREVRRTRRAPFPSLGHQTHGEIAQLAWAAALLGLLACPLTYKGGVELPHAHALFQLIYDAAHGSIDHHHDGDAADDDDAPPPPIMAHLPSLGSLTGSRVSPMTESADGLSLALTVAGWWRACGASGLAWGDARRLTGQHPAPEPPLPRGRRA